MKLVRIFGLLFLVTFTDETIAQTTRLIVPSDVGIQTPFAAIGDLLVAGPGTSQIQDASSAAATFYTLAGQTGSQASGYAYNNWKITSDKLNCTAGGGCDGWQFNMTVDGNSTVQGARQALDVKSVFNGPDSASSTNRNYVAGVFQQDCFNNDGGGSGTEQGNCYGINPVVRLHSTATFYSSFGAAEFDTVFTAGASVKVALGVAVVKWGTGLGSLADAAFAVGTATGGQGWGTALILRNGNGAAPLDPSGCVICTDGSANTITTGIDLSSYTISGNFLKGPSSQITGAGLATFGNVAVTSSTIPANGMYLSAANTLAFAASTTGIVFLSGTTLGLGAAGTINVGDWLAVKTNLNAAQGISIRNSNTGASATGYLNFSNGTNGAFISYTSTGAASPNVLSIGNGGVVGIGISVTGGVVSLPNVATGTPVASLCLDASNNIIKKTTSGACI
jgi:hypothetical protein